MGEYLDAIVSNYEELERLRETVQDLEKNIKSLQKENEILNKTIVGLWNEITQARGV